MPIPAEILAIPRPTNTVVFAYGKNVKKYGVRQRIGCKRVNGRNVPINGPTIGHIVDGVFVALEQPRIKAVQYANIDLKGWAAFVLCDQLSKDLFAELLSFYNHHDALILYTIAILRVCCPGIKDNELKESYEESFLSEIYPNVPLSRNSVSSFFNNTGKACSRISKFMQARAAAVNLDHHLLVDGTLKSNNSKINTLSDLSRKAKTKGTCDISVLYAFDLEAMEPICSQCFPGNMLDATAYDAFISNNKIKKGIIIGDKGFPSSTAKQHFDNNPDLHYINPLKRNSKYYNLYDLLSFTEVITGYEGITGTRFYCEKEKKWLYSFRDTGRSFKEEYDWLERAKKNKNFDDAIFKKKQLKFGTLLLESDLELPLSVVYKCHDKRWEIEIVMRFYKSACEFDETRIHDDYSVIASEFCDFLSTVITWRLINRFDKAQLLDQMPYKKLMVLLKRAKKARINDDIWLLIKLNPSQEKVLQKLDLLPTPDPVKRKPGRPKKVI